MYTALYLIAAVLTLMVKVEQPGHPSKAASRVVLDPSLLQRPTR
ncbi:hypothetical protein ACVWVV_001121 [Ewingella americana]